MVPLIDRIWQSELRKGYYCPQMRSEFVGLVCWAGMLFAVNSAATTKLVPLKCIILYAPLDWIMLQRTPPLDLIKWLQLPLISKACLLTPLEVSLSRISC